MLPAKLVTWLDSSALDRRRIFGILAGGLLIQAMLSANHRALFMPWSDADHPMVNTTPTAFFARIAPPADRGRPVSFGTATRTPSNFVSDPDATRASTPGGSQDTGLGGPLETAPTSLADAPDAGTPGDAGSQIPSGANAPALASPGVGGGGGGGSIVPAIPEPSTWAMMLAGFGLLGLSFRKRRVRVAGAANAA